MAVFFTSAEGAPSPEQSTAGFGTTTSFMPSPVPREPKEHHGHVAHHLPRQGPVPGGGTMQVLNRGIWESQLRDIESPEQDLPVGLEGTRSPTRKILAAPAAASPSRFEDGTLPGGAARPRTPVAPQANIDNWSVRFPAGAVDRRKAELQAKWQKGQVVRERDEKAAREKVEREKELRDARFRRLLHTVTGNRGPVPRDMERRAMSPEQTGTSWHTASAHTAQEPSHGEALGLAALEVALSIRDMEEHNESRRRELHLVRDQRVFQPMQRQIYAMLNPPDRLVQQRTSGQKTVGFSLPNQAPQVKANVVGDPARQPVVEQAMENAFHKTATAVLNSPLPGGLFRSMSSPNLRSTGTPIVPRAMSRAVLEPTMWGQTQIQGTLYGHLAQVCEAGVGFRRDKKGGDDVFVPDESDGIQAAGTRISRERGYGDKGILRGGLATNGQSSECKTYWGTGSAAPCQDHYTFETGSRITDIEFPHGKKVFREFH